VEAALIPLDLAEMWALSDWLVRRIAFNPFLSKYVSDEKRERQTLGLRVLSHSMVHSFPEFVNLPPYDLGNGAPKTSMERIKSTEEHVSPLCLVSYVPIQHNINEPQIRRNLCLAGCVSMLICVLPLTHIGDDVLEGEHGGAVNPMYIQLRSLMNAFQNSRYVGYGHLDVYTVNGREERLASCTRTSDAHKKSKPDAFMQWSRRA
jgi:hypothetical protein